MCLPNNIYDTWVRTRAKYRRKKRLHGQRIYKLWHMDYTRIKMKIKAKREWGGTDHMHRWHGGLFLLYNEYITILVGFSTQWHDLQTATLYSFLQGWSPVEGCSFERDRVLTLERMLLLWRLQKSPYIFPYWKIWPRTFHEISVCLCLHVLLSYCLNLLMVVHCFYNHIRKYVSIIVNSIFLNSYCIC